MRRPHSADIARIAAVLSCQAEDVRAWFAAPPLTTEAVRDARGLRRLRVSAGLLRAELAAVISVSVATVAHGECGRRALPTRRLRVLVDAFGVDLAEFGGTVRVGAPPTAPAALVTLRRRSALTQAQVAARLGVSGSLVSRWERGRCVPSWPHTRRLALLLQVPLPLVGSAVGRRPPLELDRLRWHNSELGPVLREVRNWRGDSRVAVSQRVAVHPQPTQRWESGVTRPGSDRPRLPETALGLPVGSLPRRVP